MKQTGACFPYNRAQRADLKDFLFKLNIADVTKKIRLLDSEITKFHKDQNITRNRDWNIFFNQNEFKKICHYLMMEGSPKKTSSHRAEYLLEGIIKNNIGSLNLYTFNEFFELYLNKFKISLRRQWIGQASESEHKRALGLMRKKENAPWIFNNVVGEPQIHRNTNKRWREDFPANKRKTVYFLMIEKTA